MPEYNYSEPRRMQTNRSISRAKAIAVSAAAQKAQMLRLCGLGTLGLLLLITISRLAGV